MKVLFGDFDRPLQLNKNGDPRDFETKARALSEDNYVLFEKQLLGCDWAFVKSEYLTMGHQVTMPAELPVVSWVLSDPPSHKVRRAQQQARSDGSGMQMLRQVLVLT